VIRSHEARIRAQAVLKMSHVRRPPVNVYAVAENLGFEIHDYDFPDSMSAMMVVEDDIRAIGVNKSFSTVRKRFSVAHELGHFLLGHGNFADSVATFEDGSYNYTDPQNRQESEANEFAAELLMPEPFLKKDFAEGAVSVPQLAKKYQVSEQAMWIQLFSLELASQTDRAT
jgi:Zn-dependent peptidase ImmA (M78 family)